MFKRNSAEKIQSLRAKIVATIQTETDRLTELIHARVPRNGH